MKNFIGFIFIALGIFGFLSTSDDLDLEHLRHFYEHALGRTGSYIIPEFTNFIYGLSFLSIITGAIIFGYNPNKVDELKEKMKHNE